jgi:hypothetical protein
MKIGLILPSHTGNANGESKDLGMNKEKVKYKTIAGDPYATEEKWMPACTLLSGTNVSTTISRHPLKKFVAFWLALAGCYVAAFALTNAVNIGYDWGYHAVEAIAEQANASNQGMMANITLGFAILPMFFGMCFGATIARERNWRFWLPVGLLLTFGSSAIACISVDSLSFFLDTLTNPDLWVYNASIFTMGVSGLVIGKSLCSAIHKRIRTKPIFAAISLQVIVFGTLLFWHGGTINPILELGIYLCTLFASAFIASYMSRIRNTYSAIAIPMIASSPIIIANFLNVLMNAISLPLDQVQFGLNLGWQALLSSIFISVAAVTSIAAGGITGKVIKMRSFLSVE